MKRIKVVYIIDTLVVGDAEKSLVDIAISNPSVDSVFITVYKGDALVPLLKSNNIEVYQLDNSFKYGFDAVVDQLVPLIDSIKPDIVHSTLFRSDIIARKLKTHRKIILVSSFVNNSYTKIRYTKLGFIPKIKLYGCQLLDAWSSRKVDLFISNSETIKQSNARILRINHNKVKVIYRGRSSNKFLNIDETDVNILRRSLGIDSDTRILLNVSRLLDRKGQMDLIKSFSTVVKTNPNTILLIAGEGNYRAILENEIKRLGISEQVLLLGNRDNISVILKMADVFVFPSHYEGLPGALIEAMFAQKIIICSDIGENKECVTNSDAVFFKTHNVVDLSSKIKMVLDTIHDFESLAFNAKQAAITKFELATVVKQYNETYYKLLEKN